MPRVDSSLVHVAVTEIIQCTLASVLMSSAPPTNFSVRYRSWIWGGERRGEGSKGREGWGGRGGKGREGRKGRRQGGKWRGGKGAGKGGREGKGRGGVGRGERKLK